MELGRKLENINQNQLTVEEVSKILERCDRMIPTHEMLYSLKTIAKNWFNTSFQVTFYK
jgi:hypothetical protein